MCVDDFDFYCESQGTVPWDPARHGRCDCGADLTGRMVTIWQGKEHDGPDRLCPTARRSALDTSEPADPYHGWSCDYCDDDGYHVIIHLDFMCDRCTAAATVLADWCDGQYGIGGIPNQLGEHWADDELYRSLAFGRLLRGATHRWLDRAGRPMALLDVRRLALKARIAAARTSLDLTRSERLAEMELAKVTRLQAELDALEGEATDA